MKIILRGAALVGLVMIVYGPFPVAISQQLVDTQVVDAENEKLDERILKAIAEIRSQLKDPDSARFRSVCITSDGKVVGEVNAKNSYGGYAGFKLFGAFPGREAILMDIDISGAKAVCSNPYSE